MSPRSPAVVLFNRDLRLHDHPALDGAISAAGDALGCFVLDERLLRSSTMGANRVAYLLEALADLRRSCRRLGSDLIVRRGDPAREVSLLAAATGSASLHVSVDVTKSATAREAALSQLADATGSELGRHPGIAIVAAGAVTPAGGDHYKVFTPYFRAWSRQERRQVLPAPTSLAPLPRPVEPGDIPTLEALQLGGVASDPVHEESFRPLVLGRTSPGRLSGGETAARSRVTAWLGSAGAAAYDTGHDDLAGDLTSHLSADLHFGCISPAEVEQLVVSSRAAASATAGADAVIRQLCWRDFYLAVTQAFPDVSSKDYRPRGRQWRVDDAELAAWRAGDTGVALVDAAMHQLEEEGFVHNRARLVAASYLTKTLGHHWREGADHYMRWLTDGDVANNSCNWQWVAGTGNDTRPNRVLNPERQAARHDPSGAYRDRYLVRPPRTIG
jgi:deoxyribodipyrimidine photo-lyase